MNIELLRLDNNEKSARGAIYIDGVLQCWTIEDPIRKEKIKAETGIPAGTYEIKFRDEPDSPKNQRYRNKYDWFRWHLWLQNVPNYQYVYIHIGNTPEDSEGCILVAADWDWSRKNFIGNSTNTFKTLYLKVLAAMDRGEKVEIRIRNVFESIGQKVLSE